MSVAKKARQRAKQRNWKISYRARQKGQMSEEQQEPDTKNLQNQNSVPDIPKPRNGTQKGA